MHTHTCSASRLPNRVLVALSRSLFRSLTHTNSLSNAHTLQAASLANRKLLADTLQLIHELPMDQIKKKSEKGVETTFHDNMGHVEESEIGKSVRFVQNAMESDKTSGLSL